LLYEKITELTPLASFLHEKKPGPQPITQIINELFYLNLFFLSITEINDNEDLRLRNWTIVLINYFV